MENKFSDHLNKLMVESGNKSTKSKKEMVADLLKKNEKLQNFQVDWKDCVKRKIPAENKDLVSELEEWNQWATKLVKEKIRNDLDKNV